MNDHLSRKTPLDSSNEANAGPTPTAVTEGNGDTMNKKPTRSSSEPINLDLQPKPSAAVIVWMLVIAIVLAILGYQMHGDKQPAYNVVVNINGDVSDYEIVVDGKPRGQFNPAGKEAGDSHSAWLQVEDGKHHIDITKSGQPFQSRDFEVKGKEYLRFDSGSTSESN